MSKPEGEFATLLKRLAAGDHLTAAESASAFGAMMAGAVSEMRMASFLTALAVRGPTVAEITGAARAMREAMTTVDAPPGAIDVCGTGGDNAGTLNVSTAAAFVVAGLRRAGGQARQSRDVLAHRARPTCWKPWACRSIMMPAAAKKNLMKPGFAFLFAPAYHPAMKHVAPVRKELGFRTVFNLLGPICNPARVRRQLIGIFAEEWLEPVAHVLADLGTEKAWVVHGADGLDEMTTTGSRASRCWNTGQVTFARSRPKMPG